MASLEFMETHIDKLADEFVQRCRRGESPTIAEYLEKHPDLADPIRELFPGLVMLECVASKGVAHPRYSLLSGVRRPDVLGDYRILQEVGRGGMGIVYEAEQISLGRHVALKVLPFQMASDECAIARFRREARTAAKLQHPHIVTVYDSGQQDAVWYYTMEFIHGQSLHDVMAELQLTRQDSTHRGSGPAASLAASLLSGTMSWSDGLLDTDESEAADGPGESDRPEVCAERIHQVIDDCLLRRSRGEVISDDTILRQHPQFASQLAEELSMLRLIEASRLPQVVDDLTALGEKLIGGSNQRVIDAEEDLDQEPQDRENAITARLPVLLDSNSTWDTSRQYFESVAQLGIQAADALAHAHRRGVIHRDIKPSNLLLDTHGHLWVSDFGTAKTERPDATSTNRFVGTLRYMAPEQIKGRCLEASDVYSLGITLYELLVLRPAFDTTSYLDMIQQICHGGPIAPRRLDPSIPRDLETIILQAIQRDPAARYRTAQEMADDLRRFLEHRPIMARRSLRSARLWMWFRHSRVAAVAVASLFSALLTAGILLSWQRELTQQQQRRVGRLQSLVESLQGQIRQLRHGSAAGSQLPNSSQVDGRNGALESFAGPTRSAIPPTDSHPFFSSTPF